MSFLNRLFPTDISYGSSSGRMFKTEVITTSTGYRWRNQQWASALSSFDVSYGVRCESQMDALVDFHYEMRGAYHSFKFKNWNDYTKTDHPLLLTGASTVQLQIMRGDGFDYIYKKITKPDAGMTFELNGSGYGATFSTTTGVITLISTNNKTISDAANADPCVITTSAAHGLTSGDVIEITSVGGMTELNGNTYTINVLTSTTFELNDTDSTDYSAHTSGGNVDLYPQPPESAKDVQSVSNSNPCVVTTDGGHGYTTGDYILISGVAGTYEVNAQVYQITTTGSTTFELDGVDSTEFGVYESGGTATKYPDLLTFTGDYYYHVTFKDDYHEIENVSYDSLNSAIELIEVKE